MSNKGYIKTGLSVIAISLSCAMGTAYANSASEPSQNNVEPPLTQTYATDNVYNQPVSNSGTYDINQNSIYTQPVNSNVSNQPTTTMQNAKDYNNYYGVNTQTQQNTVYQNQNYSNANVQAQPQAQAQAQLNNEYGVPDSNVVKITGKTIKYKHGENADPQQVIQQETRPLNAKLVNATPQQIQEAQRKAHQIAHALQSNPNPSRCDVPRVINASTSAGSEIPKIKLNQNVPTNIVFSDAAGKPYYLGDVVFPPSLTITGNEDNEKGVSRISITPKNIAAQGSFMVELRDNPVPLVFEFVGNQQATDCLIQVRTDNISLDTEKTMLKTDAFGEKVESADTELLSVVMGKKPENGKEMKTTNTAFRVWKMKDGTSLIRTRYEITSPAPLSGTENPDGTKVYRVKSANVYTFRANDQYGMFTVSR